MSRDPRAFAAELRADALTLRIMAESLDLRAAEQDRLAEVDDIEREAAAGARVVGYAYGRPFADGTIPEAGIRYAEDAHDFRGIGYVGPSHAPEATFR